jgi:hypothetical protein
VNRVLRALGYIWSTPTVAICLVVWLLPLWALRQLRPARWRAGAWEWEVQPGSWMAERYAAWAATTLGWAIFFAPGWADDPRTATHERRHLWQSLCLGPLYLPAYGALWLLCGYEQHPMERDARAYAEAQLNQQARAGGTEA